MGMLQHFKEVVYLPVGYCDHCVVSEFRLDGHKMADDVCWSTLAVTSSRQTIYIITDALKFR